LKRKIKKEHVNLRFNILIVIVYFIGIILTTKLFDLQIINGAEYRETSNTRLSRERTLEATRGDILDRTGNVLATTYTTFNLELYKTKSDDETLNQCILNTVNLLEKHKEQYPDSFPISINKKYTIKGEELKQWLNKYKLSQNSSIQEVIDYFVDKYNITNEKWGDIRKILSIRYEISTKGYSSTKSLKIAENVSRKVVAQISERNSDFPGITIYTDTDRTYGYGNLASHIIGYIGRITQNELDASTDYKYKNDDYVGRTGIENLFEEYLRGVDGKEEIEMSVDGTVTGETVTQEAIQGSNIVLTIDAKLQTVAENSLKRNIEKIKKGGFGKKYNTEGGSVVVLDVNSGEVLAMASYPDYNPNSWVGGISQKEYDEIKKNNSLFNKSISGSYEPGSIFKMVTAIAGLESGVISRTEIIKDTGVYTKYADYQPRCWYYRSYNRGHGPLNVSQAIEKSCNYYFFETADRMGIQNLNKYARYFGLGSRTGIELPSETSGTLASPDAAKNVKETWSAGQNLQAAIGQSYNNFSPIQMAKYIAIVANGGKQIKPTIIRNILNADGTESSRSEINKFANKKLSLSNEKMEDINISKENLQAVLKGMKSVTGDQGGTAYQTFKNFNIEIGGKTGSAEAGAKVHGWFAGFAPYDNPEICVVVMVENGGHGWYTAEVAKELIAEYFGMNITDEEIKEDNTAETYVESIN